MYYIFFIDKKPYLYISVQDSYFLFHDFNDIIYDNTIKNPIEYYCNKYKYYACNNPKLLIHYLEVINPGMFYNI